jgi:hypothetical protein
MNQKRIFLLFFLICVFYFYHFSMIYSGFGGNQRNKIGGCIYILFMALSYYNSDYIALVLILLTPLGISTFLFIYSYFLKLYPNEVRKVLEFTRKEDTAITWPILFYSSFIYIFILSYELIDHVVSSYV